MNHSRLKLVLVGLLLMLGLACSSSQTFSGAGGAAATTGASGAGGSDALVCYDAFHLLPDGGARVGACCPEQSPDCSNVQDGALSFASGSAGDGSVADYCILPTNYNCECACHGFKWMCLLDGAPAAFCGPAAK
jgi:hypothetical protein